MGLMERGNHRSDWSHIGDYTASGNNLFLTVKYWSGSTLTITGLKTRPQQIVIPVAGETYAFDYNPANGRLTIRGLPNNSPGLCPMLKIVCSEPPEIYRCGGMHNPKTSHPPYDPCPSDLKHS
jgi:hypothetical protein